MFPEHALEEGPASMRQQEIGPAHGMRIRPLGRHKRRQDTAALQCLSNIAYEGMESISTDSAKCLCSMLNITAAMLPLSRGSIPNVHKGTCKLQIHAIRGELCAFW